VSRIKACFERLGAAGRTALVPYVTAGDPGPEVTVPLMHAMRGAGADIIELGVPFSDPMADGPVIQRASERALANGVSLHVVLDMVRAFRVDDPDTPVILMGYLNPVEVMGYEAFAEQAREAGVDGVLTVDMPPEEADDFIAVMRAHDLDPVFLLAPTSTADRIDSIAAHASGFIYYVSLKGVTGSHKLDVAEVERKVDEIRAHTSLPVGVGFGIKDAETAAQVAKFSNAVIVGSALVSRIEALAAEPDEMQRDICALLADMRRAMDA